MKLLDYICQFYVGITLIYLGLVKLLDPVGTGLIMCDYLNHLNLAFLAPAATGTGIALSAVATLTGVALIGEIRFPHAAAVSMLIFAAMLSLSVVLLVIHATWGPVGHPKLLRNALLFIMSLFLFLRRGKVVPLGSRLFERGVLAVFAAVLLFVAIDSLRSIPRVDFTPFPLGSAFQRANDGEIHSDPAPSEGPMVAAVAWDAASLGSGEWDDVVALRSRLEQRQVPFRLYSDNPDVPDLFSDVVRIAPRADLIALMRSNGGAVYFYDGGIVTKWPHRDISRSVVDDTLGGDPDEALIAFFSAEKTFGRTLFASLLLAALLVRYFSRFRKKRRESVAIDE